MKTTTTTLEEIYTPVGSQLQMIPATMLELLSTSNELSREVIQYFFSGRGKLLRPALTLLGADIKGLHPDRGPSLLKIASSFEIFHSATLIHDDIIDSAYVRRNIPTINAKWGPQVAVLVGDYLHDKAVGTIFENGNEKITSRFLKTAGTVCDGEIHELNENQNIALSEAEYLEIIEKKTAALLSCSIESGAVLAGATDQEAEALRQFGIHFGIAFQIVDDCLDFTGNEHEFGKTLGTDFFGGVLTLPTIRLFKKVGEVKRAELMKEFKTGSGEDRFRNFLNLIREHQTIEYALETAKKFSDRACQELNLFPDSPAKQSLKRLVDYVLDRTR